MKYVWCGAICILALLSCSAAEVENGTVYDKAIVEIGEHKKLILPDSAEIRHDGEPGKLQIFMKKTLSFVGHPPAPVTIRQGRNKMGCATQSEKGALVVATYGEWDTHRDGVALMEVLIIAPKGSEIERRDDISGEMSKARTPQDFSKKDGYWYAGSTPAKGWIAIESTPDKDSRAQSLTGTKPSKSRSRDED